MLNLSVKIKYKKDFINLLKALIHSRKKIKETLQAKHQNKVLSKVIKEDKTLGISIDNAMIEYINYNLRNAPMFLIFKLKIDHYKFLDYLEAVYKGRAGYRKFLNYVWNITLAPQNYQYFVDMYVSEFNDYVVPLDKFFDKILKNIFEKITRTEIEDVEGSFVYKGEDKLLLVNIYV